MKEQDFKDMEEYALGQNGVVTGSMHNTAGLQDRPKRHNYSEPVRHKPKARKAPNKNVNKAVSRANKQDDNKTLQAIFFILGFLASCYLMSQNSVEPPLAYLIGGAIGGAVSAALHKVIIALGFLALCLFIIGAVNS